MAVYLIPDRRMNKTVSHLPGVVASVTKEAGEIGARAEGRLAAHRDTGQAQVEVEKSDCDSIVSLVDPNAVSIEFGHFTPGKKKYVDGLYIVTGAAGIIKGGWGR